MLVRLACMEAVVLQSERAHGNPPPSYNKPFRYAARDFLLHESRLWEPWATELLNLPVQVKSLQWHQPYGSLRMTFPRFSALKPYII